MIKPEFIVSLSGKDVPLYAGVLAEAHERGLKGIETQLVQIPGPDNEHTAIVKATVTMKNGETFTDYGDANPKNTSARMATALIRFASTRAKGRALRDAVNIGQTLAEELPDDDAPEPANGKARAHAGVTAAETQTLSDRVSRPAPPPVKPPADPAPGFEPWFEVGAKRLQRVSVLSAYRADRSAAEEWGLPVEALDEEQTPNEALFAAGRTLRQRLKAAKDAQEAAQTAPGAEVRQ